MSKSLEREALLSVGIEEGNFLGTIKIIPFGKVVTP
jgi:hypothetical protein